MSFRALGFILASVVVSAPAGAQNERLQILSVQAHPDDEVTYSATLYAITQFLGGDVDVAVLTDGSGGFDYSMLAEPLYGKRLAMEAEARDHLPAVRKQEMLAGGEILGLRNIFFLDAYDHMYTQNVDTVIRHVWDYDRIVDRVQDIMTRRSYDFVFTLLPMDFQHGHHKAATIAALRAARQLGSAAPVVIGGLPTTAEEGAAVSFSALAGYPLTNTSTTRPFYQFDRRKPLESDSLLSYHVVVNWHIAEHKSQGTLQPLMNAWDLENFWIFAANREDGLRQARRLFDQIDNVIPWEDR